MSSLAGLPLAMGVGTAETTNDSYNAKLGQLYEIKGKIYMLVKANSAIAAAAGKALQLQFTLGVPNGAVDYAAVNSAVDFLVAVPAVQSGSASSVNLAASDVFFAQVQGAHTGLLAAGTLCIVTSGFGLSANTSGQWANATAVYLGNASRFTNTTAATAAGAQVTGFLNTLV